VTTIFSLLLVMALILSMPLLDSSSFLSKMPLLDSYSKF
jgi:hypothetical protein